MRILKDLSLKKRKQPMQKEFVATAVGYVPWGGGRSGRVFLQPLQI